MNLAGLARFNLWKEETQAFSFIVWRVADFLNRALLT
jgi:hypothetical protein